MSHKGKLPADLKAALRGHPRLKLRRGFKYVRKAHVQDIVRRGVLRIGTCEEFSSAESAKLGDVEEGSNAVAVDQATRWDEFHESSVAHKMFKPAPDVGSETLTLEGLTIVDPFDFPTFCFTYENSYDAFGSLCDKDNGYDAVVELTDVFAIAEIIAEFLSQSIRSRVEFLCLPVVYRDTVRQPQDIAPDNLSRVFEKSARFVDNVEGRIVFFTPEKPSDLKLIGFDGFVRLPGLSKYLSESTMPSVK